MDIGTCIHLQGFDASLKELTRLFGGEFSAFALLPQTLLHICAHAVAGLVLNLTPHPFHLRTTARLSFFHRPESRLLPSRTLLLDPLHLDTSLLCSLIRAFTRGLQLLR
jgi:hypothetical protein